MSLYYLGTSIWIDYYEKREQQGEYARLVLEKIIKEESRVCISDIVIKEIKRLGYNVNNMYNIISILQPAIIKKIVRVNKTQSKEARVLARLKRIPFLDAIHSILARDNEAILISRDRHFEQTKSIVKTMAPEEMLSKN
jgi:predicted nucleic acid-binding protein